MPREQQSVPLRRLMALIQRLLSLRGRPSQFWRAFDESLVPMLIVGADGEIVDANPGARLLFHRSLGELVCMNLDRFLGGQARLGEGWHRLRERSTTGTLELQLDDGLPVTAAYCSLDAAIPGEHLLAMAPARWSDSEWATARRGFTIPASVPLSPREREVLSLVAAGRTLEEIGSELHIAVTTVKTHLQHLIAKLGARNRAHAVALALQGGVDDPLEERFGRGHPAMLPPLRERAVGWIGAG